MSDIKIKKVILYKTGIGYFEKSGKINLNTSNKVILSFKNSVMNDLLKTFSIQRTKGNYSIGGISYESADSDQSKLLQDSLINLPEHNTMKSFLTQLRGFEIQVNVGGKVINGIVVGLQERISPVSERSEGVITQDFLLLANEINNITPIPIKEINSLEILDKIVKEDFKFFMDVIKTSKKVKNRNVSIFFQKNSKKSNKNSLNSKENDNEIGFNISFLQETPAWKVSYRLFIQESNKEEKKEIDKNMQNDDEIPILLQGWAIIDNVLDEPWEDIQLTLVSGLPISFIYDSYSPLWINRPSITRNQNLSIPTASSDLNSSFHDNNFDVIQKLNEYKKQADSNLIKKITDTNIKGSRFEYKISVPVTVKRNQSSLIPLIEEAGTAKKVSIYNEKAQPVNPMSALEFSNFTKIVLEEGPISIFKDDVFEGEAILPFINKNEQQRIPYAIDQGMEIYKEIKSVNHKYHQITLGSSIWKKNFIEKISIYTISNITDFSKILILEHPIVNSYKIFETPEPDEKSANFYRYRINIEGKMKKEFILKERSLNQNSIQFETITMDILKEWTDLKLISNIERDVLLKVLEIKEKIQEFENGVKKFKQRQNEISKEHNRLRENLKVLTDASSDKQLRQRYIAKMETQETELDATEKQIDILRSDIKRLNALLKDFAFKWMKNKDIIQKNLSQNLDDFEQFMHEMN